jgi:hypothetical protein
MQVASVPGSVRNSTITDVDVVPEECRIASRYHTATIAID